MMTAVILFWLTCRWQRWHWHHCTEYAYSSMPQLDLLWWSLGLKRRDHVTDSVRQLHWLMPIKHHIEFKLCFLNHLIVTRYIWANWSPLAPTFQLEPHFVQPVTTTFLFFVRYPRSSLNETQPYPVTWSEVGLSAIWKCISEIWGISFPYKSGAPKHLFDAFAT